MAEPSLSLAHLEDDIAQPDHFYGTQQKNITKNLHPSEDPNASRGIPVFKPTWEEFQDFEKYMESIQPWGMISGIVKVIPPQEWKESLPAVKPLLENVKVRHPIEQNMLGISGIFRQQNIEKRRTFSMREWFELGNSDDFRALGVEDTTRNRVVPNTTRKGRKGKETKHTQPPEIPDVEMSIAPSTEISEIQPTLPKEEDISMDLGEDVHRDSTVAVDGSTTITSTANVEASKARKQVREAAKAARDAEFWEHFDPDTSWLPSGMTADDYTPEFISTLERLYWRTCGLGKPALYGADMAGSLFDHTTTSWNVAHLPSALSRLLPRNMQVPGVNTPYLYFGMWRATFAWHVEDMDLFSINYIHWGGPKHWYAVPQARAKAFEGVMKQLFPSDKNGCPQFLRHKSYLASPTALRMASIKPNTLVQHAGEFVITYPRGYHAGFNIALNCAESVNFALDSWLDLGRKAGICSCVSDSVRIDVDGLLAEKALIEAEEKAGIRRPATEPRNKQILPPIPKLLPIRAPKKRKADEVIGLTGIAHTLKQPKAKRPRKEISGLQYPCCLCVSNAEDGLLSVNDPPFIIMGVPVPIIDDQEVWRAHEVCAMITPETWVDEIAGERRVFGIDAIDKDRWGLKCGACSTPEAKSHGAPIQCTKGKCPRAFHVSCAQAGLSGVFYRVLEENEKEVLITLDAADSLPSAVPDGQLVSVNGASEEQPTHVVLKTIKKLTVEVLCSQHNPHKMEEKRKLKAESIFKTLSSLPPQARVRIRVQSGVFECTLLSFDKEKEMVEVFWSGGIRRSYKWNSIVWGITAPETHVGQFPPPGGDLGASAVEQLSSKAPNPQLNTGSLASTSNGVSKSAFGEAYSNPPHMYSVAPANPGPYNQSYQPRNGNPINLQTSTISINHPYPTPGADSMVNQLREEKGASGAASMANPSSTVSSPEVLSSGSTGNRTSESGRSLQREAAMQERAAFYRLSRLNRGFIRVQ